MASNPYASAIQTTETPREREYRLLARANRLMAETKEQRDVGTLYRAVLFNRQVWNTFLIDLTDERNALPQELKGMLISIGIWVEKFSDQVCDGEESVDDLIEVNRTIMDGLT
ncbi:MAG: flagellar biosynthesis regulator FlaF [Alphaproteobacteria bacterium]|jgi:flagellar protein FlaF|nr:flagellar biosynthesis regulator FlaF [Alphaproteobacteria bacterium]MDP6515840.1 flagellar biosynthesis regulator FlaF [Alphaproteobacteria bacterium]|tara:strand:+ start:936 stop:1274 length:339 start_codon:yes stop_codon:yes gene_type:complete